MSFATDSENAKALRKKLDSLVKAADNVPASAKLWKSLGHLKRALDDAHERDLHLPDTLLSDIAAIREGGKRIHFGKRNSAEKACVDLLNDEAAAAGLAVVEGHATNFRDTTFDYTKPPPTIASVFGIPSVKPRPAFDLNGNPADAVVEEQPASTIFASGTRTPVPRVSLLGTEEVEGELAPVIKPRGDAPYARQVSKRTYLNGEQPEGGQGPDKEPPARNVRG